MKLGRKDEIIALGMELLRRLYPVDGQNQNPGSESTSRSASASSYSFQDRLQMTVGKLQSPVTQPQEWDDGYSKEFEYYERHKVRGPQLDKLFDALRSAQPTSTQNERNFSLAAGIATNRRARMAPEKIDAACFLKGYFHSHK